jgi:DNA-binding winged helix-turn-helix (wHTH) protein/tetratricopeptide (TPR) repeat protein
MDSTVKLSGSLRFGTFELDLEAGELLKQGIRLKLQEQQFQILVLLTQHPGKLVTRDELRRVLWPDHTFVDFDRNLNKAVNKLRAVLCDSAEVPRFIETLHRRGYRFIAPIAVHKGGDGDAQSWLTAAPVPPDPPHFDSRPQPHPTSAPSTWWRSYWPSAALLLLVGVLTAFYLYQRSAAAVGMSAPALELRRSVAVLGFKNLSVRSDESWVSTALADWLTTDLSAGGQLRVIPAESVARMQIELSPLDLDRLSRQTLLRIGKNLPTDLVVVGSYAIVGEGSAKQVRLDLRLQDTRTGETMDAVSSIGNEANLLDLVSRAGEELRAKLDVQAISTKEAAEVAFALPANHDAARLYSEGLEKLRVFNTLSARDLLQQSITMEPNYALSHSALASAWAALGYDKLAAQEAKKAFELAYRLSRADRLLVEAGYREMSGQWNRATEIYGALFDFFPDSLEYGLALANAQFNDGKGQQALETIVQLRRLPPPLGEDPRIDLMEARSAESLGDFKKDLASSARASKKATAVGASLLLAEALSDQAWALLNLGDRNNAWAAAEQAGRIFAAAGDKRGVAGATNMQGIVLQSQGDNVAAQQKYEQSLLTFRELGSQLGVANELDDLGDTSFALGNLDRSHAYYEQAMRIYRDIGHENGICLVKGALATVLMSLGENRQAIETANDAVTTCRALGDRSKTAIALLGLAKALRLDGRIPDAMAAASESDTMFEDIGDRQSAARAKLMMAEIFLDERNPAQAQSIARAVREQSEVERVSRDAALANAILARASLMARDLVQAQQAIQRANAELADFRDREVELVVAISAGRLHAAANDSAEAETSLEEVAENADHLGFIAYELEPRIALAEMEIRTGNLADARSHLRTLAKQASDHGFGLFAAEAQGDLNSVPAARE